MAMQIQGDDGDDALNSTINTTPLVDVMLVLLIIFLIAVPVVIQTARVELPKASNQALVSKPGNVNIGIDSNCQIYWNLKKVEVAEMQALAIEEAKKGMDQPEIHIRGDKETPYECVGKVMFAVQRSGIVKVAYVSEPNRGMR